MKPGATTEPEASRISALGAEIEGAIFATWSRSTRMSSLASVFDAGSITRPFLISSMRGILCMFLRLGRAGDEFKENRHADGEAVGHLLEDARLRAVGNCRIDFQAANHRTRMHQDGAGLG